MLLVAILMVGNLIENPEFVASDQIAGTLAIAAPFVIAAIASTPPILSGGGGIDLSVGPLLGFVNVILVVRLIPNGWDEPYIAVPLLLLLGAGIGLVNGLLVAVVRLQPIVATLGMYLILVGWSLREMPEPIGEAPDWLVDFRDSFGPVPGALILMLVPVVVWVLLMRTPYYRALMCVGGDDRASFSAGVNITIVRIGAYVLSGMFAAVAGMALTALIGSGDPTLGPQYTLAAIAAVALGGTSLAGGRGRHHRLDPRRLRDLPDPQLPGRRGRRVLLEPGRVRRDPARRADPQRGGRRPLAPALHERGGGARRGRGAGMSTSEQPVAAPPPPPAPAESMSGGEQVARVWRAMTQGRWPILQVVLLVGLFLFGSATLDGYNSQPSIRAMLTLASLLGIAALGQTLVVLLGGFDLSVPFIIGASNVMCAELTGGHGWSFVAAFAFIGGAALCVGAINGFVAHHFVIHPLIVTLATGSMVAGGVLAYTKAKLTGSAPDFLTDFVSPGRDFGPLPGPGVIWFWAALAVVVLVVTLRTTVGRRLYATGANQRAARLALVSTTRVWTGTFAVSAFFSAVAGTLLVGFSGTGLFNIGDPYLFTSIASVVIGGTSLLGARGDYLRTVLGALILIQTTTILAGRDYDAPTQQVILGVLIVLFVATYARESHVRTRI